MKCDNCGGNLIFDPDTQSLVCQSCNTHFRITPERDKELETSEDGAFEADVFTCPNCGGELIGFAESIVSFCPFCGSEVAMITEKVNKKLPELIIPFEVSRDECKSIYQKGVRKFIFAPKKMNSDEFIDRVQGVYVPYWYYVCNFSGSVDANFIDATLDRILYEVGDKEIQSFDDNDLKIDVEPKSLASPLYLMTWRDEKKVSYSLINGQNGTLSSRLPVDILKYFLASVPIALPLFLLFYFGKMTIFPDSLSVYSGLWLLIAMIMGFNAGNQAYQKEKLIFGYPLKRRHFGKNKAVNNMKSSYHK